MHTVKLKVRPGERILFTVDGKEKGWTIPQGVTEISVTTYAMPVMDSMPPADVYKVDPIHTDVNLLKGFDIVRENDTGTTYLLIGENGEIQTKVHE